MCLFEKPAMSGPPVDFSMSSAIASMLRASISVPNFSTPITPPDTRIYFFDMKRPVEGLRPARQLFHEEAQLARFLWVNKHFLGQAVRNLRLTDREKTLAPGSRPDLVAIDTKTRELVAIELKAGHPDQGIVAQAARYMTVLKDQAEAEGLRGGPV